MNRDKRWKVILAPLVGLAATVVILFGLSTLTTRAGAPCVVNNPADDGSPGTLRRCLLDAQSGDTITFDTGTFPSADPVIIAPLSPLPDIVTDGLTIDGGGAGVTIDGSQLTSVYDDGFRITSNDNTIRGLTIQNFPGDGIDIRGGAQENRIEDCVIRGNGWGGGGGRRGVRVDGNGTTGNTITSNSITGNDGPGIVTTGGGNAELPPPIINSVVTDASTITVTGFALPGVTVELFRDPGGEGAIYLGYVRVDSYGNFTFTVTLTEPLSDDNITATATDDSSGNTSMFTCYPIPIPDLVWPLSGDTTPGDDFSFAFGPRLLKTSEDYRYDWHRGLDIYTSAGTIAYAVANGKVHLPSGYSDLTIQLNHEDGCYYCNYLHMSAISVTEDMTVTQGMTVGLTGGTENLDHLHFEIRRGGYYQRNAINPFMYLPYADNPLGHTAVINGVYMHTASVTPTVTARVVVTTPANELDFNRLALTVGDDTEELDWRAVDFHVFNIQKSTIEDPEVLDTPYVDDICIMPARFNRNSDEYRIDFVFYGLRGSGSITLTAEASDVHSNAVSTTTLQTAGEISISPPHIISSTWPGTTITYTHILSNGNGTSHTLNLNATSAQSWAVRVSPTITLLDGQQREITVSITVPAGTYGRTDCTVVTAADDVDGTIQVIAVDVTNIPYLSFLPVVMKSYSP